MKKRKTFKIILISLSSTIGLVVLLVIGYLGYVVLSYSRIGDKDLSIDRKSNQDQIQTNQNYRCITYNLGFGAYSQDYTFFLDTGYDLEGKSTCGHYSKAKSKDDVLFNTNGAINTVKEQNIDFALFQEVDTSSDRSHHVNQDQMIEDEFEAFDHIHAVNFNTAFLPYPLYDMHGKSKAGLTTISKYKIEEAKRIEYPISNSLSKFFDLDRCFSYSKIKVSNGKNFYLVNSHMSAYDKGGKIREQQIEKINQFLDQCKQNNDYVLLGGDFNHDLITNNPNYSYTVDNRPFNVVKKDPDWVSYFFNEKNESPLTSGYQVYASDNNPTCRNNDIEWIPNETYVCCVDGFIASNNIKVNFVNNIQTKNGKKGLDGFAYSDHEPSLISFELID